MCIPDLAVHHDAAHQVAVKEVTAEVSPAPDESDSPHGTFEVILSAPVIDRDGETLGPDEWEQPLPDHITFDIDHGMSVASTVGSGRPELDEHGNLRVRGTYASTELAQTTRALVTEGHIRTTSVAFLRKQEHKSGSVRRELLNGAFVAVPANPAALVLSSKAAAEDRDTGSADSADTSDDANSSAARAVQAIHDHAIMLGATCPGAANGAADDMAKTMPAKGSTGTPLREQLAGIDTASLPGVVRAVLAALGLIDPDDPGDAAERTPVDANRAALSVRARQLRALSVLPTREEV